MKYKKYRLLIAVAICALGILALHSQEVQEVFAEESTVKIEEENVQTDAKADAPKEKLYSIGSVSKVYVTTAVMQLAEDGKVNLDAPLTEYIPDFRMADERYKEITVRMLMNHTSGIMGSTFKNALLYGDNDMSYHDGLLAFLEGQRLKANPGAYAAYCNDGFTLLEMVIENVSGMSFTEYVDRYIADEIGAENTGTALNRFQMEDAVSIYSANNILYENDYCMCLGSGGVLATASEMADFGATFFTGNEMLLTESSKEEMTSRWAEDPYMDDNGLGWDYVEALQYQEAGVKVIGKGGDTLNQHAMLVVAPDEEISVSILSSGGNSIYNIMVAYSLLNVALEEKGIYVEETESQAVETVLEIPEEYAKYEGKYATSSEVWKISFPDMKYMKVEKISYSNTMSEDYMLTTDGRFVRMEDDLTEWADAGYPNQILRQDYNQVILTFSEAENGKVFIKKEEVMKVHGIGSYPNKTYVAESLEENPISKELQAVWEKRSNIKYGLYNNKYSAAYYDGAIGTIRMIEEAPGYLFRGSVAGTQSLHKITGMDTAEAFSSIPSSASRDLSDFKVEEVCFENGDSFEGISSSIGDKYIFLDDLPEFTEDISEVSLYSEQASWYHIGEDSAGKTITVDRPKESAVYVYNKYGEVLYNTHMKDWMGGIPLPKDGYILFVGEDSGKIKIVW